MSLGADFVTRKHELARRGSPVRPDFSHRLNLLRDEAPAWASDGVGAREWCEVRLAEPRIGQDPVDKAVQSIALIQNKLA